MNWHRRVAIVIISCDTEKTKRNSDAFLAPSQEPTRHKSNLNVPKMLKDPLEIKKEVG